MKKINLHLISDSTGKTLGSISRAVISQFDNLISNNFTWPFVKNKARMQFVIDSIKENPGIILYTMLEDNLVKMVKQYASQNNLPCISILSNVINIFSNYIGKDIRHESGRQYSLDREYFDRIEAMNYTINHDDGKLSKDLYKADIIIVGISRTSKSPTSIYLSYRGLKVANIPFISKELLPKTLFDLIDDPNLLIIGLTINPDKLINIRQNRLVSSIKDYDNSNYIDYDNVKKEIIESRKIFNLLKCNIIDVTNKSVEETATKIMELYQLSIIKNK